MELHWSHAISGKHGAAGEGFSVRDSRTIDRILERNPEDDFKCTYFRQRTTRIPAKEKRSGGLSPVRIRYNLPCELSDGYTDSDSESDNTSNVERWLASLPANDAWSSAPNYSALDGSEGVEGIDEIQEDTEKNLKDEPRVHPHGTNDSRRSFVPETGDSKIKVTGDEFSKPMSTRQDEISVVEERRDLKAPRKTIKRSLKARQRIPAWMKMERNAETVIETKKLAEEELNEKRNIPTDEKAAWSKNNILETTESRTAVKKPDAKEDGDDKLMQEMVNRLLTISTYGKGWPTSEQVIETESKTELFSRIDPVRDSKELLDSKKSQKTIDSSLTSLEIKRAKLSGSFKKISPKLTATKTKSNSKNQLPKRKKIALRTQTLAQNPRGVRKISQEKKPSVTKRRATPIRRSRYAITSGQFVENLGPEKNKSHSRTVRFQDEVTTGTSSESWRQTAMTKAARNKHILQTVEQIVDDMNRTELQYEKEDAWAGSGEMLKASQDEVESNKCKSWSVNRKRPMHSIENKTIGSRKPTFTNPFVEDCLDKAMEFALSKYKRSRNTWTDFNKAKLRENISSPAYEPPAKKRRPKSFTGELENMQRQDFTSLDSWQSIHNYFVHVMSNS